MGSVNPWQKRGSILLQLPPFGAVITKLRSGRRSAKGAALSEFAPALFVVFVFGLLPVVDAIFIGINYASARYLNELQLREAQKLPRSKCIDTSGSVISGIPKQWRHSLLGGLADDDQKVFTQIDYTPVPWQPVGSNQTVNFWFVSISTTVGFRRLLSVPFLNGIPGLGSPIVFSVVGRRPVENNRFLNE